MKDNPEQIRKLVIRPDEIEDKNSWRMSLNENLHSCMDCNSNLSYIKINWGVIMDDNDYGIVGNRSNRTYELREIGLTVYCAECGAFHEHYSKWFYPEDRLVITFDEIDDAERYEVEHCLHQFNQKGDFKFLYNWYQLKDLKEKLMEYEKEHPIKKEKKKVKKK